MWHLAFSCADIASEWIVESEFHFWSGGIAICAYAQVVDELRQDPFEMRWQRE